MNDENLKKGVRTQFKSGEEAARKGRKGGINSGKSKRIKKTINECTNMLLAQRITDESTEEQIRSLFGVKRGEEITYALLTSAALIQRAVKGDVQAIKLIRDMQQMDADGGADFSALDEVDYDE